MYEGIWSGTNSQGSEIGSEVEDNKIISVIISYRIEGDGCSTEGSVGYPLDESVNITNKKFALKDTVWATGNNVEYYTLTGTFDSENSVAGNFEAIWQTCGNINLTWTAERE